MPNLNDLILALLKSPLGRFGSGATVVLAYTGPKSGRYIQLPVVAARDDERWLVIVGRARKKRWHKAFRTPIPATISRKGVEYALTGHLASESERADAIRAHRSLEKGASRWMSGDEPVVIFTPRT